MTDYQGILLWASKTHLNTLSSQYWIFNWSFAHAIFISFSYHYHQLVGHESQYQTVLSMKSEKWKTQCFSWILNFMETWFRTKYYVTNIKVKVCISGEFFKLIDSFSNFCREGDKRIDHLLCKKIKLIYSSVKLHLPLKHTKLSIPPFFLQISMVGYTVSATTTSIIMYYFLSDNI